MFKNVRVIADVMSTLSRSAIATMVADAMEEAIDVRPFWEDEFSEEEEQDREYMNNLKTAADDEWFFGLPEEHVWQDYYKTFCVEMHEKYGDRYYDLFSE